MNFDFHFSEISMILREILQKAPSSVMKRDPSRYSPALWAELRDAKVSEWCKVNASANHSVRQIHDYYGWMAKHGNRGKCAGALYRSEQFMHLPFQKRNGSRSSDRSIHIEHAVPVAVLVKGLKFAKEAFESPNDLHSFLMEHSICVALTHSEEKSLDLAGVTKSTNDAFSNEGELLHQYPLRRYLPIQRMLKSGEEPFRLFNMVTRQEVDIEYFTFSEHLKTMRLAEEKSGASPGVFPYHLDIFDSKIWLAK